MKAKNVKFLEENRKNAYRYISIYSTLYISYILYIIPTQILYTCMCVYICKFCGLEMTGDFSVKKHKGISTYKKLFLKKK